MILIVRVNRPLIPRRHKDDYSTDCTTAQHTAYENLASIMVLVFPIGVPGFMYMVLLMNRKWLRDPVNEKPPEDHSNADRCVRGCGCFLGNREKFEFLVKDYKPEYYYCESPTTVANCWRKRA